MRNNLFLGVAVAALVIPAAASAQETTSTIRGTVTANGAPVAGAQVTVTNVPTGSATTITTDSAGSFNAGGLRVGGPYTVSVSAAGYPTTTVTDIQTVVAQEYDLPIELTDATGEGDAAAAGGEVVVTASRIPSARNVSQGPATVLSAEQIASVASVNRDVRDLLRRDPFARLDYSEGSGRAVSFAGQNARFNRFSVDGVPVTDNFGLNPDGLPTRRSPVPFDAIGQFQTKVAPYDVREGNFQGGAINAILKSGTNEFHGTGFYAYSSDELNGDRTKAGPGVPTGRVPLPNYKYENYGAQLSGPIIADRLFFMVAGERIRAGTPIPEGTATTNAGTVVPLITDAQIAQISSIAQSRYNYATGGIVDNSNDRDDRLVAKLDANLSDTQRASLTYMYTKDSIQFNQNTFTTGTPGIGLESNGYRSTNQLHTGVFQLNSDWSDEFSTEFRAFYKDYQRGQDPLLGRGFAQFQVCTAPTSDRTGSGTDVATSLSNVCQNGFGTVSFGPDISRQSNELNSRTYGGLIQTRLTRDNHDLRIFAEFSDTKIFNLFLQRTAGDYYFDSIADFQAGNAQRLRYQNAVPSLDPANAAARFRYQSFAFGIQDNWRISDALTLNYGIRYDTYGGDSRPALNQNFVNRIGYSNNQYISGLGVAQPRIGFTYRPLPTLTFRGGIGVFSGGSPDVYISNSFSNTGFLSNNIDIRQANNGTYLGAQSGATGQTTGQAALTNVNGRVVNAAANTLLTSGTAAALAPVNALDPDFKLPSQWRGTFSADFQPDILGGGWNIGADFFYSAVRNQVYFEDARVVPGTLLTPDGRVRAVPITGLTAANYSDGNQDIILTNTKRGRSLIGVARIDKNFDFGLSFNASYTYQDVKDETPATSSTAGSNYGNGAFFDGTRGAFYGISNDQVRHFIKYGATLNRAFFGDYKTNIALFGETRIGKPFSYVMAEQGSGRSPTFGNVGTFGRYLLYVPTGTSDSRVSYDSVATQTYLDNLINNSKLAKYRGAITPRNVFNSPWFTKVDLHLSQELPTGLGASRITVFADVENFGNLLNKNWGQIREYAFPYTVAAVRMQCLTTPVATGTAPTSAQTVGGTSGVSAATQPCAQYRYLAPTTDPALQNVISSRQSLYTIRVGARFSF